ncbi:MAG: histidinol-phosphate transaminase [Gammaproteobacteria bacterium]|nr:MAG: histidinol-phosphate transaminase [Gammaproteobacteria bacterium]
MSRFWSPIVHTLDPYVPGEQPKVLDLIKLNTNENPYPPSPLAISAMKAETGDSLRLYSDPNASELKSALADNFQLAEDQVFVGNGSDEVLAHSFQAFFQHTKPLLFPDISYSFYPVYCGLYQVEQKRIPLNDDFDIDINDFQQDNTGIIFPNPNAPTGKALPLESIKQLLAMNRDTVVIVDEAYIDFGADSAASLVNDYDNLLVVQTFSKSRSLAGLRVGFALGHCDLIGGLERVKNSFNPYPLDRIAIKGAVAAINDTAYFEATCQRIIESRDWLTEELSKLGFDSLESSANFIFTQHKKLSAKVLSQKLRDENIIVRYFDKPRIDNHLRITVGSEAECKQLVSSLKCIIESS